jgi:hypothetical protein
MLGGLYVTVTVSGKPNSLNIDMGIEFKAEGVTWVPVQLVKMGPIDVSNYCTGMPACPTPFPLIPLAGGGGAFLILACFFCIRKAKANTNFSLTYARKGEKAGDVVTRKLVWGETRNITLPEGTVFKCHIYVPRDPAEPPFLKGSPAHTAMVASRGPQFGIHYLTGKPPSGPPCVWCCLFLLSKACKKENPKPGDVVTCNLPWGEKRTITLPDQLLFSPHGGILYIPRDPAVPPFCKSGKIVMNPMLKRGNLAFANYLAERGAETPGAPAAAPTSSAPGAPIKLTIDDRPPGASATPAPTGTSTISQLCSSLKDLLMHRNAMNAGQLPGGGACVVTEGVQMNPIDAGAAQMEQTSATTVPHANPGVPAGGFVTQHIKLNTNGSQYD